VWYGVRELRAVQAALACRAGWAWNAPATSWRSATMLSGRPPPLATRVLGIIGSADARHGPVSRVRNERTGAVSTREMRCRSHRDTRGGEAASDELLLARALAGDRAALSELTSRLSPIIRQRVARVLRRRGGAGQPRCALDDLTQEVFVRLLAADRRVLRAWDPARGLSLSRFVALIAEREASSVLDSQRRTPRSDGLELHADLDELHGAAERGEQQQIARDLLVKLYERLQAWLSPRGRALFQMLYVREEPLETVARRFGMPPSAVYAWRSRVGKRARELLDELA
jgi:RNA polymerase sigma factor (sigma-70 family)